MTTEELIELQRKLKQEVNFYDKRISLIEEKKVLVLSASEGYYGSKYDIRSVIGKAIYSEVVKEAEELRERLEKVSNKIELLDKLINGDDL